ncbi:SDR family oxidoreductase [Corynebacterium sp. sy017]|uniref:SDR family NAD(P)-dependent oxidoreductase n=1 Tax=unclassified Corynebacterium TaxID=2624378 RepID=UPI0011850596|nr:MULTISPECIES: SDR family oxidoreductase [unclassified Corynebacterium]MBP3089127.1 SDR family oxidoreductase [Corynebacterium sp. sy017]QDZ42485.1 SDR family oxidoreductase [Corynebacterium sp. sy039]TSD91441.1 SDR family oxidoreductase [Corynebacterium sp. SY003]
MNGLKDNVYIVTGAGSGLGYATAIRLVTEGAKIAVVDLQLASAERTVSELNTLKSESALAVQADVTDAKAVQASIKHVVEVFGKLDGIVNCAGIALGEGGVVECSESAWDKMMAVNVKSIFLTGKYGIPYILKNGGGSIVNIASVFGFVVNNDECAYAASKGAVINLTRQMALQHASDKIRVNAICPADADTPMIDGLLGATGAELDAGKAELAKPIPMGHLTKPSDVAAAIAFLLSSDSAFITGVALPVDGGFLIK